MLRAVKEAQDQAFAAYRGDQHLSIQSGISTLDAIIPGFFPGELTILGGRPGSGKSAVALSMALNAARQGHGVAIASLEMTPSAMAMRALSEATAGAGNAVPYISMRKGDMSEDQARCLAQTSHDVANLPIYFLSNRYADIGAMMSGVRQIARATDLKLLVVDYAQLMTAAGKSRYEQITAISIALKRMSVQLNIPVIALSQLSRQIESRDDKRPMMSDLRESGQLEQDADNIIFCYREEYYLLQKQPASTDPVEQHVEWQSKMDRAKGRMEIIVNKQRMGETGTARCLCAMATNSVWGDEYP
nr:DnaB-like helicase C-terminal domain-containing protein [Paracoccus shanxieyensis]